LKKWKWFLLIGVVLLLPALQFLATRGPFLEPKLQSLDPLEAKRLDILLDSVKQLATWAGLVLAAVSVRLFSATPSPSTLQKTEKRWLFASLCLAVVSLGAGYLVRTHVQWMLGHKVLNLDQQLVAVPATLALWCFILSIPCLLAGQFARTEQ